MTSARLAPCGQAGAPQAPPATLVIFGAGGDLTHRLLAPALLRLVEWQLLPDAFELMAFGHSDKTEDEYRNQLLDSPFVAQRPAAAREWLKSRVRFFSGDFEDATSFERLRAKLDESRQRIGSGNVVFYLAIAPTFILPVVEQLSKVGLLKETQDAFRRVVIEKPFGHDLQSAIELNANLSRVVDESQIFRIDHFLGKETVRNILALRFANAVFEPMWSRHHVAQVEITAAETVGVETRGRFYDKVGALRDMVPNHMFELLSLIAMEPPNTFGADDIDRAKTQLMAAVRPVAPQDAVRGQYTAGRVRDKPVRAYREEPDVSPQSRTETYVALKLAVDNWRWNGVPFLLRTGKSLREHVTQIVLRFRPVPHAVRDAVKANTLVLGITPVEKVSLEIVAKCPGPEMNFGSVPLQFDYGAHFKVPPQTGYETLLYDVLVGDKTPFRSQPYVESCWRVVDPLLKAWQTDGDIEPYAAGSLGPAAADRLAGELGWFELS